MTSPAATTSTSQTTWLNISFLLALLISVIPTSVTGAETLTGGLGKILGEKYKFDDVLGMEVSEEAFVVHFEYVSPLPVLSEYHLILTPLTYRVMGIVASDKLADNKECLEWKTALGSIVMDKYYDEEAGDKLYVIGDQEGILYKAHDSQRSVTIRCSNSDIRMTYADRQLNAIATKEASKFKRVNDMFNNGKYTELLPELEELVENGVLQAQTMLAIMYRKGMGVDQNNQKAEHYYTLAANRYFPTALFNLGTFLMDEGRLEEAHDWLLKGANMGDGQSQYNLGLLFNHRIDPPNFPEAFKWFRESAKLGDVEGQYNTCHMYSAGDGVSRNEIQAYMWCEIASRSGHNRAPRNRDHIAQRMTSEEIEQARMLADQWWARHH